MHVPPEPMGSDGHERDFCRSLEKNGVARVNQSPLRSLASYRVSELPALLLHTDHIYLRRLLYISSQERRGSAASMLRPCKYQGICRAGARRLARQDDVIQTVIARRAPHAEAISARRTACDCFASLAMTDDQATGVWHCNL